MSFNNFSVPDFSAPFSWAAIFPPTPNTMPYTPVPSDVTPYSLVGMRPDYYVFGAGHGQEVPAPAIPQVPAFEAVPGITEAVEAERPAKRQRLLAAAPAWDGARVEAPVERATRAHIRSSGKRLPREPQACTRCRGEKKKCNKDPQRPKCKRCENFSLACTYEPTPKQLELARKQAAESADSSFGHPGPVETAAAGELRSSAPGRRILPRPRAPAVSRGGSTAGQTQQRRLPEAPVSSFGGFAAGSPALAENPNAYSEGFGGFAAGPEAQQLYPRRMHLGLPRTNLRSNGSSQWPHGLNPRSAGFGNTVGEFWQRPQVPESTFRLSDTRPYGYVQYPRQPLWRFGDFGAQQNNSAQWSEQPAPESGGYLYTRSGSSSALGGYPSTQSGFSSAFGAPGSAFGGSPAAVSPYARDPAVALDAPPPSHGLPKPPEWSWKPFG